MAELNLWGAVLNRDDIQALDPIDRMALISIATTVADAEPDIDGFLPAISVRSVPWEDPADLRKRIESLAEKGFLTRIHDPDGWIINGWLERVVRYQPGNADSAEVRWGQKSSASIKESRRKHSLTQKKYREKTGDINTSEESLTLE